jgi:hypothetical protein
VRETSKIDRNFALEPVRMTAPSALSASMSISESGSFGVPLGRMAPETTADSVTPDVKHPYQALGAALKRCKDLGCGLPPRDYFHRPKWPRKTLAKTAGCSVFKLDGCLSGRLRPDTVNYRLLCDAFKMEFDEPTQADGHKDPDRVARFKGLITQRAAAYKAFQCEFEAAMARPDGRQKTAKPMYTKAADPAKTLPSGAQIPAGPAKAASPISMVSPAAILKLCVRHDDPEPHCPYEAIVTTDISLSENNALADGQILVSLDMKFPTAPPPTKLQVSISLAVTSKAVIR